MERPQQPHAGGTLPGVKRIAVLRANGIGDLVFVLPALEALRAAYPEAEITLLGLPWHETFLGDRPGPVDRCVVVPVSRGVRQPEGREEDPAELDAFFAAMRTERFDLALQLHGGGRYSNPFVRRLGAGLTAGLRTPDAEPLDRWVRYVYYQPEVLRYLEAVALVGATPVELAPRLALRERDAAEATLTLGAEAGPFAVLNPGAGDARRRWPVEKLAAAGDALSGSGTEILVAGGPDDVRLADQVVAAMRKPARSIAGQLSLGGFAALLARAAVVISNDSGPLHLARAAGAPTVGIYWCGNLVNAGPLAVHRHRSVVSWRLLCPVCGVDCTRRWCDHRVSFVAEVAVDEVVEHALDLLSEDA